MITKQARADEVQRVSFVCEPCGCEFPVDSVNDPLEQGGFPAALKHYQDEHLQRRVQKFIRTVTTTLTPVE